MEGKNAVFQKLKPPCVALSQAALALSGPQGDQQAVTSRLETLKYELSSATSPPSTLDPKLAEYAFFPISQVLKVSHKVSLRALELAIQCIAILVDQGWRSKVPAQLAAQLIILCTMLAEKNPKGLGLAESTPDLRAGGFWCLQHLFSVIELGSESHSLLTDEANIPQLGQTISVALEGIYDGIDAEVQLAAMHALEALVLHVLDREIQASFLPGIVSKLTRVLTPQTKQRRNHRVLTGCLGILGTLLQNTLTIVPSPSHASDRPKVKSVVDAEWQAQAATQLKPALTSIFKLKSHSRTDVQDALGRLYGLHILDLDILITTDQFVAGLLQTILFDWMQSLPTIMQGSDEQAKISRMSRIQAGYDLLIKGGVSTVTMDQMLANILRDSVAVTLTLSGVKHRTAPITSVVQSSDLDMMRLQQGSTSFTTPLIQYRGQADTIQAVQRFARLIGSSSRSSSFATDLARSLRQSDGKAQVANLWLLLTATESALEDRRGGVEDLLDVDEADTSSYHIFLEELYSFSLSLLSDSSDEPPDTQLQALALRALALRARIAGKDFRYELVDALYPVLHTLATPDEDLQQDSITTLNIFTSACGYKSVKDLVVENVDYLTNAVALRLNAFDVSPQAPQVLLMMVRLAGPSLLPYLQDSVESIFAALEDYHGYPLLVELLFKVLAVIAEEGAKAPQLAIMNVETTIPGSMFEERWQPTTVFGLANLLREHAKERAEQKRASDESPQTHPRRPWKDIDDIDNDAADQGSESPEQQMVDAAELPPPTPRTYNLLFKIAELTRHFLPSASPSLRTSLLFLVRTTVPAIAKHENSFLPLINTLWPEIVSRLDDAETHVVCAALEVVSVLCEHARDFMRSRITQLWPRLVEIHHGMAKDEGSGRAPKSTGLASLSLHSSMLAPSGGPIKGAVSHAHPSSRGYDDTSVRLLREALVDCVTSIVKSVQINPDVFDEAVELVGFALQQEKVEAVFVEENSDAVWLARLRHGRVHKPQLPQMIGKGRWRFADVCI
ncbi:armadillo-type protein [Neohortaea acidophila]|uniref:Armadillo-type protein n=1 Tax=Neohortaea acidophila TaxID=245834 RepID=A0A6A6PPC3_9PEZI|nr:armadillo-type protein [Neohortaea acidophila]KAF2481765.1 armadillo-type protein [Neohortaea acidophila]